MLKPIKSNNSPGHTHNGLTSVVGLSTNFCPGNNLTKSNKMKNKYEDKPSNWNMVFCMEQMENLLHLTGRTKNYDEFIKAMYNADEKARDGLFNFIYRVIQIKINRIESHREALNRIDDLRIELGTLHREMEGDK